MKIRKEEVKIVGNWIYEDSRMIEDENTTRIKWLKSNFLKKIATDESGWSVLYQDPQDERYWELCYEQGETQGGGPPSLIFLPDAIAQNKYHI